MMRTLAGFLVAFALGGVCRAFGIPSPAPPVITGALLVVAMTAGYVATDRWVAKHPATHKDNCAGPSGR